LFFLSQHKIVPVERADLIMKDHFNEPKEKRSGFTGGTPLVHYNENISQDVLSCSLFWEFHICTISISFIIVRLSFDVVIFFDWQKCWYYISLFTCQSPSQGQCECRRHVEGPACDKCKALYWNLSPETPEGCTSKRCYKHTHLTYVGLVWME